jgi:ferric-dicitrate binding protein FerR (iron transport regulator)
MNEENLIRYIKGEITSESDILMVLEWIESSPENQKFYNQLKNLWVATGLDYPDKVMIPDFSFQITKQIKTKDKFFISLLKYVAVFILAFALGSYSLYFFNQSQLNKLSTLYNTINVPYGQRSHIILYDGTNVWLNSGTKFRYPVAFSSQTRNVFLEGEAYFEVAKDSVHPFLVSAGQLNVEVLGTHFNICAYPEDNEFTTTLEEGSVNAVNTMNGKRILINPGEQIILKRETNEMNELKVNSNLFTSWKENMMKFDNATFADVIKKMERWYDVKIKVDPSLSTKDRFTMTIKTESLREMLSLVSKTTKMKYEIKENNVLIRK